MTTAALTAMLYQVLLAFVLLAAPAISQDRDSCADILVPDVNYTFNEESLRKSLKTFSQHSLEEFKSEYEKKSRGASVAAVVYGIPVSLGYNDEAQKEVYEAIKSASLETREEHYNWEATYTRLVSHVRPDQVEAWLKCMQDRGRSPFSFKIERDPKDQAKCWVSVMYTQKARQGATYVKPVFHDMAVLGLREHPTGLEEALEGRWEGGSFKGGTVTCRGEIVLLDKGRFGYIDLSGTLGDEEFQYTVVVAPHREPPPPAPKYLASFKVFNQDAGKLDQFEQKVTEVYIWRGSAEKPASEKEEVWQIWRNWKGLTNTFEISEDDSFPIHLRCWVGSKNRKGEGAAATGSGFLEIVSVAHLRRLSGGEELTGSFQPKGNPKDNPPNSNCPVAGMRVDVSKVKVKAVEAASKK